MNKIHSMPGELVGLAYQLSGCVEVGHYFVLYMSYPAAAIIQPVFFFFWFYSLGLSSQCGLLVAPVTQRQCQDYNALVLVGDTSHERMPTNHCPLPARYKMNCSAHHQHSHLSFPPTSTALFPNLLPILHLTLLL